MESLITQGNSEIKPDAGVANSVVFPIAGPLPRVCEQYHPQITNEMEIPFRARFIADAIKNHNLEIPDRHSLVSVGSIARVLFFVDQLYGLTGKLPYKIILIDTDYDMVAGNNALLLNLPVMVSLMSQSRLLGKPSDHLLESSVQLNEDHTGFTMFYNGSVINISLLKGDINKLSPQADVDVVDWTNAWRWFSFKRSGFPYERIMRARLHLVSDFIFGPLANLISSSEFKRPLKKLVCSLQDMNIDYDPRIERPPHGNNLVALATTRFDFVFQAQQKLLIH